MDYWFKASSAVYCCQVYSHPQQPRLGYPGYLLDYLEQGEAGQARYSGQSGQVAGLNGEERNLLRECRANYSQSQRQQYLQVCWPNFLTQFIDYPLSPRTTANYHPLHLPDFCRRKYRRAMGGILPNVSGKVLWDASPLLKVRWNQKFLLSKKSR